MEQASFVSSAGALSAFSSSRRISEKSKSSPRSRTSQTTRAVLGTRVPAGFGVETKQTYKVKVVEKDRCTLVDVEQDQNLRRALLDARIDLYTLGGKLRNCGGAGQCGTCLIAIEDGVYNTNGRTPREEHLLGNRPDNWRLACRTLVHGDVTIRTKPQV